MIRSIILTLLIYVTTGIIIFYFSGFQIKLFIYLILLFLATSISLIIGNYVRKSLK